MSLFKSFLSKATFVGAILPLGLSLGLCVSAAAQGAPNPVIIFQETTSSLEPIYTRPIDPMVGRWSVEKYIWNGSQSAWTDFHITLQTFVGGAWVDSGEGDGISFDQPTAYADWLKNVKVDINGIFVGGWHVDRTNQPIDMLDFYFDDFVIKPGDQLSLHFEMYDTAGTNIWRLKQVPTIPEPSQSALLALGLAGLALAIRRARYS
ncbi:PEP-CTERM sorting domain-containing protein [Roseateles sp.]|uniref:PEP-CTERM sorting domain-containing protein n=1 Tax=Roseateles sp. TaxID=1971397 RepID=UPI002869FBB3|nr:PEP-CTERM sorting domain-containing protein [Roseateles sp.]